MPDLTGRFLDWLREEGCSVQEKRYGFTVRKNGEYLFQFQDPEDGESPEALVWCLKELERRGKRWGLQKTGTDYALIINEGAFPRPVHTGPTMTAAAVSSLTGGGDV